MTPPADTLGQRVHRLRRDKGLTLATVAESANVHPSTLVALERGHATNPTWETIWGIAQALGVSPTELVDGVRGPEREAAERGFFPGVSAGDIKG